LTQTNFHASMRSKHCLEHSKFTVSYLLSCTRRSVVRLNLHSGTHALLFSLPSTLIYLPLENNLCSQGTKR
jgi:hypothetical protein